MNALMPSAPSPPLQIKKRCKCLKQDQDLKTQGMRVQEGEVRFFPIKSQPEDEEHLLTSDTHRTYQIAKGERTCPSKKHTQVSSIRFGNWRQRHEFT